MAFRNSLFVFELKGFEANESGVIPTRRPSSVLEDDFTKRNQRSVTVKGKLFCIRIFLKDFCLKENLGSMHCIGNNNFIVFMCSLNVTAVRELMERNLFISDIQRHDSTRDLIMLNQSRMSQVELK